ncbi:MAG: arylesterase [Deltaproteobacteria bacterium HGW-Deltaproteobacteria-8]|jgi:acyl-CoA thioesterase-1|nr:MAG: arylesterase [Deltaproteobacteria bacterium HGW-Deltaproteobacteria-8]
MWIVRPALHQPYTFVVAALLPLMLTLFLITPGVALSAQPSASGQGLEGSEKAPRLVTILVLGDSVTAGYGLPIEQSFPSVLESMLLKSGYAVKVINGGVSGDTTTEGRTRLPTYFLPSSQNRPDIVIIELGANDGLQRRDPTVIEANLDAMLARIQAEGARILLIGARAVRNNSPEYIEVFSAIFPRLAAKHNATLYPLLGTGILGNLELVQQDRSHPNEKGARIIAQNLYPLVAELIAQIVRQPQGH